MTDIGIKGMQRGLERALRRASLADDRELMGRVREEGHRFVFLLNGLVRTSRLYTDDNTALDAPAAEFDSVLRSLIDLLGAVHLVNVEDQVFVNDVRLRVRPQEQVVIDTFAAELQRHEVGGISFHAPLEMFETRLLGRALGAPTGAPPRAALVERLSEIRSLDIPGRYRFRVTGERPATRRSYTDAVREATSVACEAVAALGARRLPNPLPVRRAVVDLVDSLPGREARVAAAPQLPGAAGLGERHLVSVCQLALQLGRTLGLSEGALADLGVAAMLHDVGYLAFGARDRENHPSAGLRLLLRQRGFHEGKLRRLRAVLEHHLPARDDGSGTPSIFSRLLRIADDYDVLTAPRPLLPGLPPATAQAAMWAARGSLYDPDLLALFVQILGLYPPGSLLALSDERWVVSVSGGRDEERFAWPVVRVVRERGGAAAAGDEELDLFESRQRLRPKRVLNPVTQEFDVVPVLERALL
jgi:hypothetical protein